MNTLTSHALVNVDKLNDALASPPYFWVSAAGFAGLSIALIVQILTDGRAFHPKAAPVFLVTMALCLAGMGAGLIQTPPREPVIEEAFSETYPGFRLLDGDLECIEKILNRPSSRAVVSCDSPRRVNGVLVQINFTEFEGDFAVTLSSGRELRSVEDLGSPAGQK